jgi:hypothetical protein
MIDELRARLRAVMDRPIPADQRRRAGAIALTIIAAGALIMVVASPDADPPAQSERTAAAPSPAATGTAPPPEPTEDPANLPVPSEEEPVDADERASQRDVREAKSAAREFLADYLPYSYGRGDARSIANATDELRDELATDRPRATAAERARRPRLEILQTSGASALRMGMLALVDDGKRRYTLELELARIGDKWLATGVGA